jgi:teichuronic acid biosynthesis glycosyltransferase TuaC
MKLLVLASSYPYNQYTAAGIYNERSVLALKDLCETVEVMVPRPLGAPLLSRLSPRWNSYAGLRNHEVRRGVSVFRPGYLQIPRVSPAFWADPGTYFLCRSQACAMHQRARFDAILAFGLAAVGGLAWRLGQHLGIPAIGWATGSDVRSPASPAHARSMRQALSRLDLVFYQSQHLRQCASELLSVEEQQLPLDRHVVMPRGIPAPPDVPVVEARSRIRREWQIRDEQVLVLYVGRVVESKGVFDLLEAIKFAALGDSAVQGVLVGSMPGFDDTEMVQSKLKSDAFLNEHARLLPSCDPSKVWELMCAADVFVLPSFGEGMPNALLEAMVMGVASVAYDIPPVIELEGGSGAVVLTPTGKPDKLGEAILGLSARPQRRRELGERGKKIARERFMLKTNIVEVLKRIERLTNAKEREKSPQKARSLNNV